MQTIDLRQSATAMYGRTLQFINLAIQSPIEDIVDETLLMITLTALFEKMYDSWDIPMPPASAHIRGLMSMINARGPTQFRTVMARNILLYAYFNWTTTAMPELAVTPHLAHTHLPPLSEEILDAIQGYQTYDTHPAISLDPNRTAIINAPSFIHHCGANSNSFRDLKYIHNISQGPPDRHRTMELEQNLTPYRSQMGSGRSIVPNADYLVVPHSPHLPRRFGHHLPPASGRT